LNIFSNHKETSMNFKIIFFIAIIFTVFIGIGCTSDTGQGDNHKKCTQMIAEIKQLNAEKLYCLSFYESIPLILTKKNLQRKRMAYDGEVISILSKYGLSVTDAELNTVWKLVNEKTWSMFKTIMALINPVSYQWTTYKDEILKYAALKCNELYGGNNDNGDNL
jgi:hypothetical protein